MPWVPTSSKPPSQGHGCPTLTTSCSSPGPPAPGTAASALPASPRRLWRLPKRLSSRTWPPLPLHSHNSTVGPTRTGSTVPTPPQACCTTPSLAWAAAMLASPAQWLPPTLQRMPRPRASTAASNSSALGGIRTAPPQCSSSSPPHLMTPLPYCLGTASCRRSSWAAQPRTALAARLSCLTAGNPCAVGQRHAPAVLMLCTTASAAKTWLSAASPCISWGRHWSLLTHTRPGTWGLTWSSSESGLVQLTVHSYRTLNMPSCSHIVTFVLMPLTCTYAPMLHLIGHPARPASPPSPLLLCPLLVIYHLHSHLHIPSACTPPPHTLSILAFHNITFPSTPAHFI